MKPGVPALQSGESEASRELTRGLPLDVWQPVLWLLLLTAGALAVNFAMRWSLPLPFCLLRESTGIPCPACGSTRSLLAWTHLDLITALRFNPLFFLACVGLALWTLLRVVEGFSQWRMSDRLRARAVRLPLVRILVVLLAVNWVYLYLTLPR